MPLSKTKKILLGLPTIFFVIFGIPFIATLGSIAWVKFTSPPPLLQETADTTPVHVQLGGQDFLIPANYFNKPYSDRSRREQTALIHAHWPDMSGSTKETIARRKKYVGHLNRISILVQGTPVTPDRASARLKIYNSFLNFKHREYKSPTERLGLRFHEDIRQYGKIGIPEDLYVDNTEHPSTMITCTGINDKKVPYPSCSQYFDYKNLRFKIGYSRKFLSEWKEIQMSVESLIDQFAQNYADTYPTSNQGN
jgi:hypothetical protein